MATNTITEEEYRETELGFLPKEWSIAKFGDIVNTRKGRKPSTLKENPEEGSIPYLTADYFRTGTPSQFATKDSSAIPVDEDDVIFIWDGSNAGDVFTGLKGALASTMVVIQPEGGNLTKRFLYYFIKTKFAMFNEKTTGSTIPHVSKSIYENLALPLPPLPEQQNIAFVLSTVQEAQQSTERVIGSLRELKKSLMMHLFTYGTVSFEDADKVKLKETEIGKMPEGWEVEKIKDLLDKNKLLVQFGFPCGKWNDKGNGIAHIRPFNVSEEGNLDLKSLKYIQPDKKLDKYLLKKGDVLFNNTNSQKLVGKTAFWSSDIKCVISNHMTIIRIVDNNVANPMFIASYLHKKWYDRFYMSICMRHVNQSSISSTKLGQVMIPLPSSSEQQQIASILSSVGKKIDAEEQRMTALTALFNSLLKNLMTAKIRVKELEVQNV